MNMKVEVVLENDSMNVTEVKRLILNLPNGTTVRLSFEERGLMVWTGGGMTVTPDVANVIYINERDF